MAKIRINGDTSGYIEIQAPDAAGSNTLVLPTSNGSANQFLRNGSTAGTLQYSSMVEDSASNVGIGTASIEANTNYSTLEITGKSGSGGGILRLKTTDRTTAKAMLFCDTAGLEARVETNHPFVISTNNTEKLRVLAAGGLTFNGDTAAANALDDYEEGSWVPALDFSGGTTGITYAARNGAYIKIGRLVMVRGGFILTNKGTSSGSAHIGGLPFTVESISYADSTAIGGSGNLSSINGPPVVVAQNAQARALLWYNTTAGARVLISEANFNNNTEIYFSMVYTVS